VFVSERVSGIFHDLSVSSAHRIACSSGEDPERFMDEILSSGPLYAVGGMHTSAGLTISIHLIDEGRARLTDVPETWLHWPAQGYFFEDALENHYVALLALGNADNEVFQLEISFVTKCLNYVNYSTCSLKVRNNTAKWLSAKTDRNKKGEAAKLINSFNENGLQALGVKAGQFGQMRSLVAVNEKCWQLLIRIINRDYIDKEKKGKLKKSRQEGKKRKPLGNVAPLFDFANLDSKTLEFLLESVVEGKVT